MDVLIDRQVAMLIESRTNRTLPSHIDAFTPPVWKLRAPMNRAREVVDVVVHGGLFSVVVTQMPPVRTSCSLLLGAMKVVNPAEPPHHVSPRRSLPRPCLISDAISVLLV